MIGIFGGTFDPVHNGHINTAREIQQQLGLEKILFIPLHIAVHRQQPCAGPRQRAQMLELALQDWPELSVDSCEIERRSASYTVDTLLALKQRFADEPLCLIMGMDAFNHFHEWKQPDKILELCHLVVMQRPGHKQTTSPAIKQLLQQHPCPAGKLPAGNSGNILLLPVTPCDVSSTEIRHRLREGKPVDGLLPAAVTEFISQQNLYRDCPQHHAKR